MLVEHKILSKDALRDVLGVPTSILEELCCLPSGYFSANDKDRVVDIRLRQKEQNKSTSNEKKARQFCNSQIGRYTDLLGGEGPSPGKLAPSLPTIRHYDLAPRDRTRRGRHTATRRADTDRFPAMAVATLTITPAGLRAIIRLLSRTYPVGKRSTPRMPRQIPKISRPKPANLTEENRRISTQAATNTAIPSHLRTSLLRTR